MTGKRDYFDRALEKVKFNHERADITAMNKKDKLYGEIPELKQLDDAIKNVYFNCARRKLNGEQVDFDEATKEREELENQRSELLKCAGFCDDDFLPKYRCKKCNDTGFCGGKICECVKSIAAKMLYDDLNRDVPLENCTFQKFDLKYYPTKADENGNSPRDVMSKIKSLCEKYADNFSVKSDSILFYGATGLGKTHLSLAIANKAIEKGYNVVYAPLSHILQKIEEEHFSRDLTSNQTLNGVINCDLLIIDDLGTEFLTQFVTSAVYDIVNSRILSGKPTIINTNLSLEEIERRYSDRIVSRIAGNYKFFKFVGVDVRTLK